MTDLVDRLGLAELLAASGALAALRDREGRFTWASPGYLRLLGATAETLPGTTLADWLGPAAAAPMAEDERVWRTGEPVRWRPSDPVAARLPGEPERRLWLAGHKLLVRTPHGPALGVVAVEVSDWHADRAALAQAEQRLAQFVAHAPVLATITDEAHRYVWVRDTGLGLLDRPLAEVVGRTVHEVLPPEVAEQTAEQSAAVLLSGLARQVRLRVHGEGGESEWSGYRFPLPQPGGAAPHVGTILFDVTEFRAARREATLWRNRFTALLDRVPVPAAISRTDGTLDLVNPEFAALLGTSPARLHGTVLTTLMAARQQDAHDRLMRELGSGARGRRTLAVRWAPRRTGRTRTGTLTLQVVKDVEASLLLTLAADPETPGTADTPPELSTRETEILTRVAAGDTTSAIASAVGLTPDGVTYHVTQLCRRFQAANRTALVARAYTTGVLDAAVWPPASRE
ncbi:PAS domain S-box-containing protein [Crossiella equi]|uniref:PAS domain S-box-containing protein n=1 Tax=Crossiella equi TaxID=130796 RepID=A0ABS5AQI5_9PSEU|nr:PAS domain-containing protein [Crossiella equi]MBP2478829.1 PAS domain S-box-containing protein [Crossiella equi]